MKPPIDYSSLLERTEGDVSFIKELIDTYIEEFKEKYPLLQNAIEEENFRLIQALGHSMKGSSSNLSFILLQEDFLDLEMAGKEKNIKKAKNAFSLLESEFKKLLEFLEKTLV